ncbi:MAG: coniferyl aldehyde dehydrogenase [Ectothiorhodospiraceae bacterium]|nr:coniferyl aldehyde dehydrogenase [Ectothiorhodospiraceae bacterium]
MGRMQLLFQRQRQAYRLQAYPDLADRQASLDRLYMALQAHREALAEAVSADFGGRSPDETLIADIIPTLNGIRHARRHLRGWMRGRRRRPHPFMQPVSARVIYQPLGVVGVMVPWNYPVFLALAPLLAALSAGNRIMLKLSECTPRTGQVIQRLLAHAFAEDEVAVVLGEQPVSQAFAALPFDHLLFTGSTQVGRKIMAAAAENLTPVTLELGGKSPAIVDADAALASTVERILFGKTMNAGQTCIAPDYVLCTEGREQALVDGLRRTAARFYPTLKSNPDYTSIINQRQHQRLCDLLSEARERGATVIAVNPADEDLSGTRKLPLHLVLDAPDDCRLMREEIFGPILPVVTVRDLDAALDYVRARPRPLALYYFGKDRRRQQRVLRETHAGGVCLNDTIFHVAQDNLPFGGVGESGMGHYHGHAGFLTFSKEKPVLSRGRLNSARLVYPPYGGKLQRLIQKIMLRWG